MAQAALNQSEDSSADMQVGNKSGQYLTFQVAGEVYGFDILNIREIIEYGHMTPVPMMPDFIAGVINLRGAVVPVVDLSARFTGSKTQIGKRTSIIILDAGAGEEIVEIGVIVDLVNAVLEISSGDIEAAPSFGTSIRADFIGGMAKVDGKFLILLDELRVLSIDELSVINDLRGMPAGGGLEGKQDMAPVEAGPEQ